MQDGSLDQHLRIRYALNRKTWGAGTSHIGVRAATNALHANRFAAAHGRPMNLAVTIAWHRLGIDDEEASSFMRRLRYKVRQAWRYRDRQHSLRLGTFDDIQSQENPAGAFGPLRNTHWSIHVPAHFEGELRNLVDKYLKKVTGMTELERALGFSPIKAPGGWIKYQLKGVAPGLGEHFFIKPTGQGFIAGRGRTTVSRSIGLTARRCAGWTRTRRPRTP